MQQYSTTSGCSQGTLDFLHQLVERHLESVLAANQPELLPEPVVAEPTPEPVKLAGTDVEGLIVACSETVKAMAWKFARSSSGVDVDDMYSIGMVVVCEAASRAVNADNPVAYLCGAAKHAMINEWRRVHTWSIASLDTPLSNDSEVCLLDVLSNAPAPAASSVSVERERVLHGALDRLSVRQRAAVRHMAGLFGYGAHSLEETSQVVRCSPHGAHMLDYWGRRALARDAVLCEVMGVEVQ